MNLMLPYDTGIVPWRSEDPGASALKAVHLVDLLSPEMWEGARIAFQDIAMFKIIQAYANIYS